jgi:hypothetical protein
MTPVAASDPTNIPAGVPEDAVDELFGLPVDEFTARRDALAKELRGAAERDAAAWVKALRRPSAAAWIVNQLARTRAREARELLRAGDELRGAHERVVAGSGDADDLRAAVDAEHEAARALVADAPGFLDRDGNSPSRATLEKVAETLRAVALDDEARAGFEHGRLTRERSASGFGPMAGAVRGPRRREGDRRAPRARPEPPRAAGGGRAPGARAKAARAAARKALKEAKADRRARAGEAKAAERELGAAQREAERAQRRLERAAAELDEARSRAAEAESRVGAAEAELQG